ncbi:MAG TPA: methyltransferase domain-containing protein [Thermoanaerobaculia bacterium]|nr:methyltransferase domain-containing protein [Thermoanaerobaculia bacterium]
MSTMDATSDLPEDPSGECRPSITGRRLPRQAKAAADLPEDPSGECRPSITGRRLPRQAKAAALSAFDALAEDYDAGFTHSALGTLLRQAVWRRLDACFAPGATVLELNCGTGEDAVHLARRGVRVLATDLSGAMVERAQAKVAAAGLAPLVETRRLAIEELAAAFGEAAEEGQPRPQLSRRAGPDPQLIRRAGPGPRLGPPFDGALSNFGGLNCVGDLRETGRALAGCLRRGATAVLCVMGPAVPWEWAWFLLRGEPRKAFRRLRRGGATWRGMTIRYPTIGAVRRALAPAFELRRAGALGALLPPTYVEPWAARHGGLVRRLDRWERRLERWPPLPWLADHYLLELTRR